MIKAGDKAIGIFLGIVGVVFFSSKAVMVKLAYGYGIDTIPLLLLRMVFSLPFYVIMALLNQPKDKSALNGRNMLWIVLLGFVGYYLASLFDFMGLKHIKASLERVILFTYPTIVLILSVAIFKERITSRQVLAILLSYVGIVITFFPELQLESNNLFLGSMLVFLSAVTYASYIVGSGWIIPKFGATVFTSYAMIVSCMCVIVHYLLTTKVDLFGFSTEVYLLGFAMAIIATVIPSYLVSMAIKKLGAANFSILGSIGPISTILLANVFLDERFTIVQVIGTVVVISAIYVLSKSKKAAKS